MQDDSPSVGCVYPNGQLLQIVWRSCSWYVFALQSLQLPPEVGLNLPLSHVPVWGCGGVREKGKKGEARRGREARSGRMYKTEKKRQKRKRSRKIWKEEL